MPSNESRSPSSRDKELIKKHGIRLDNEGGVWVFGYEIENLMQKSRQDETRRIIKLCKKNASIIVKWNKKSLGNAHLISIGSKNALRGLAKYLEWELKSAGKGRMGKALGKGRADTTTTKAPICSDVSGQSTIGTAPSNNSEPMVAWYCTHLKKSFKICLLCSEKLGEVMKEPTPRHICVYGVDAESIGKGFTTCRCGRKKELKSDAKNL